MVTSDIIAPAGVAGNRACLSNCVFKLSSPSVPDTRAVEDELSQDMNSRRNTYTILIGIILLTVPCYCIGIVAYLRAPGQQPTLPPPVITPTSLATVEGIEATFTPSPTSTVEATSTPSPSPSASATGLPSVTPSQTPTQEPSATASATATDTITPSPTASATATNTATVTATASATPSLTPSLTPSQTSTSTPTDTATATPSVSPTASVTPSATSKGG